MQQQDPYGQPQWGQQPQQSWGQQPEQAQSWGQQPQVGQHPGYQHPGAQQPHYGGGVGGGTNPVAAEASPQERARFIERTYMHLALAIGVFTLLSIVFQVVPLFLQLGALMLSGGQYGWLAVLAAFIGVSWLANSWALNSDSLAKQYAGLILYTLAESVLFIPLIMIARMNIGPESIFTAAGVTLAMFAGMTGYVFISKQNFSFLGGALSIASFAALGIIVASAIFGFNLGIVFTVAMIGLACGYVLFHTSAVLHDYRVNQYVAAALSLFASVALLFWYVLQLFMRR